MIVMDKSAVWKPGISMRILVPRVGMTEAICQKNSYIFWQMASGWEYILKTPLRTEEIRQAERIYE